MKHTIYADHASLSRAVAETVAAWIRAHPGSLLCLAAGDTPLEAYRLLIDMQASGHVDLASVDYVGLDEWVGLGSNDHGSCRQVMDDGFYIPAGIPADRRMVFNGLADPAGECGRIASWIRQHDHIGLTVLGIGLNGHVGFNEPGAIPDQELCRVVALDETTRLVSSKYFSQPKDVGEGVTVSLPALLQAEKIVLMASGAKKQPVLGKLLSGVLSPSLPASMLLAHPELHVMADRPAWPQVE